MTSVYEFDIDIPNIYLHTEINIPGFLKDLKVRARTGHADTFIAPVTLTLTLTTYLLSTYVHTPIQ